MKTEELRRAAFVFLFLACCAARAPGGEPTFTATVTLQQGVNGYDGGGDDSLRPGQIKLADDVKREVSQWEEGQIREGKMKREVLLEHLSNYRHVLRWSGLEKIIQGKSVRIVSAKVQLYYCDEFWSYYNYTVTLHRALAEGKDDIEKEPAGTAHVFGDRCSNDVKTQINSWVDFSLRPAAVQAWVDDPKANHGLVLSNPKREAVKPGSEGAFLFFRSNTFGVEALRPKLTIAYEFSGNVPPYAPQLLGTYAGATVGDSVTIRWREAEPLPDANGDPVTYEVRLGRQVAEAPPSDLVWKGLAKGIAAPAAEYVWNTAAVEKGKGYKLGIRAVDNQGAASAWVDSDGTFEVVAGRVSFNVGVATPLERVPRSGGPSWRPAGTASLSLAKGEAEALQLVVLNAMRPCNGVTVAMKPLAEPEGRPLPAAWVTWNPVGYVKTTQPKYDVPRTGWWADVLLPARPFDLENGKVQPVWVTVRCPRDAAAGTYLAKLEVSTPDGETHAVRLTVTVWDFVVPVRGTLKTMCLEAGENAHKFYGLNAGQPEAEELKKALYAKLCESRIGPGGKALCGFGWDKPCSPVTFQDGKYDFPEVDRWGEFLVSRGMNAFVIASFPRLGKFGFPDRYSEKWQKDWTALVTAYADHLRAKGWLDMACSYNIDEAPAGMWGACKANYRLSKSAAKDLRVMQCLNDPKGVAALAGCADTWDVNVAQYHQSRVAERQAAGDEVWWCVCCWPSDHPNLFLDYPAIDARIMGWLSWKLGVSGFEYWSAASWGKNTKPIAAIESEWIAKAFGEYNGDGYLVYPGPDRSILSSIRLEALRDGFEDYEYLVILRKLVREAKAKGRNPPELAEAEMLLGIPDEVCRKDLTFTQEPAVILKTRERVARAIQALAKGLP
ncbi:MAG: DUF6067 family protein [Planctomycetota bacterium]|nr:DUF6067 family protein [Planctomycetota bacterium]